MSHVSHQAIAEPAAPRTRAQTPTVERLAFGLNLTADVIVVLCLLFALGDFHFHTSAVPALNLAAWLLLIATILITQLGLGHRITLPRHWYHIARIAFAVVIVLDIFGVYGNVGSQVTGPYPMAAIAVGAGLLTFATDQKRHSVAMATGALGVLLLADFAFTARGSVSDFAPSIVNLAIAMVPPFVGLGITRAFDAMLQFQADLSQAQGTTSASGAGLGLSATEQLVQLDRDAEELLDGVATGRTALPLTEELAERASTIATQLRLGLVAGKSQTWLHHALTESSVLGPVSHVDDPDGLAAQLAPDQRDGLLSAIWMFAGDGERVAQSLTVTVRRRSAVGAQNPRLAITIEVVGVPRRRVDQAAWQAIARVGRYSETWDAPTLRIDVECALDVVADR
ncbi:hypothetical protein [Gryllotalpicola ginsengisoli]|uniref:hypothetical protein n=1 Tax=Gryllotalpicola ginsengisoli TaxID=444608 RepID=UPI000409C97D|nr:hypothetical protein [Gryllotalpicola ginsengisoli]